MTTDRINVRLPILLGEHVDKMLKCFYETPSEYIRDLIRRDMEKYEMYEAKEQILKGYKDFVQNKYFESSGNFIEDLNRAKEFGLE